VPTYICPMHSDIRRDRPGICAKCGMQLLPEGTRFMVVRHMFGNSVHLAIMAAAMLALMAAAMKLMA